MTPFDEVQIEKLKGSDVKLRRIFGLITQYYLMTKDQSYSQTKLHDEVLNLDDKDERERGSDVKNILNARGNKNIGDYYLYIKDKINTGVLSAISAPECIRVAIKDCFDIPADDEKKVKSYSEVIKAVINPTDDVLKQLENQFVGDFHIFRYSAYAFGDEHEKARVIRAFCKIERNRHIELHDEEFKGVEFIFAPKFTVRYSPTSTIINKEYHNTEGVLVSTEGQEYVLMVGYEESQQFPLSVTARQSIRHAGSGQISNPVDLFQGIVRRNHEEGDLFVSKCVFLRADGVGDISRYDNLIGMIEEESFLSTLDEEFHSLNPIVKENIIKMMSNKVSHPNGKSAILL